MAFCPSLCPSAIYYPQVVLGLGARKNFLYSVNENFSAVALLTCRIKELLGWDVCEGKRGLVYCKMFAAFSMSVHRKPVVSSSLLVGTTNNVSNVFAKYSGGRVWGHPLLRITTVSIRWYSVWLLFLRITP